MNPDGKAERSRHSPCFAGDDLSGTRSEHFRKTLLVADILPSFKPSLRNGKRKAAKKNLRYVIFVNEETGAVWVIFIQVNQQATLL